MNTYYIHSLTHTLSLSLSLWDSLVVPSSNYFWIFCKHPRHYQKTRFNSGNVFFPCWARCSTCTWRGCNRCTGFPGWCRGTKFHLGGPVRLTLRSLAHWFYAPPLIRAELHREAFFLSGRHQLRIGYLLLMVRPGGLSFVFRKGPTSSHTDGLRFFTQESTVFSLDSFTFSMTTNDPHPHVRTCAKRAQTGVDRTEIDEAKGRCGRRRRKLFAQPKLWRVPQVACLLLLLLRALVYCTCLRWSSDSFPRSCQYIQQLSLLYHRPSVIGPSPHRTVLAAS